MIPPQLAISAASVGLGLFDRLTGDQPATPPKRNDQVDKADFLQLLVAQLANQDPLNPLESAEFSSQLATFSSLEQLTQINEKIGSIGSGAEGGRFDAVAFIGGQVTGKSATVAVHEGKSTALGYTIAAAGEVRLQVLDASGREVTAGSLGPQGVGAHVLALDDPKLGDGLYTVKLTVTDSTGKTTPLVTTLTGQVTGVDLSSSTPTLLIGDVPLALADVTRITATPPDEAVEAPAT